LIRCIKREKTDAYTFQEEMLSPEALDEYLEQIKNKL